MKGKITIDREFCKACFLCMRACPQDVIAVDKAINSQGVYPASPVNEGRCTGCANCFEVCPDVCIDVYREQAGAL